MLDTSTSARARYAELMRRRAPHERLAIAMSMTRAVRELAEAGIRARFPNANDAEVRVRLAVRLYGRDTVMRLFAKIPADAT